LLAKAIIAARVRIRIRALKDKRACGSEGTFSYDDRIMVPTFLREMPCLQ
jgi:hypothetical protein